MPDNLNDEELDAVEDMPSEDMAELFEGVEDSPGNGEASESALDEGAGQGDSDSGADSTDLESEDGADKDDGEEAETEESEEDSENEDAEGESEESEEAEAESESADEDAGTDGDDVDVEAVQKVSESYDSSREAVIRDVAKQFAPAAQAAKTQIAEAEAEIEAIEKKYSEPDEDGFVPNLTVADQRRIAQLEYQLAKGKNSWETITAQLGQAAEKAENELIIRSNLQAFPKLAAVEEGFRAALARGIKFDSPAEAIEVSAAIMRAQGKATAKAKPNAPKPKSGELEKAALEASIAKKKAGAITAGKGSTGSKGAAAKANPYKGLSHEERSLMEHFDKVFPQG